MKIKELVTKMTYRNKTKKLIIKHKISFIIGVFSLEPGKHQIFRFI